MDYVKNPFCTTESLIFVEYSHTRRELLRLSGSERCVYWGVKRLFDIVVSFAALVLLSPVLFAIALLIFLDDPKGSPVFTQERVGRHGRKFKMYKFRTMVTDAENMLQELQEKNEKDGPVFKIKNDPRITKFGSFLRRSSLDELLQFINVLKGDMSIVGPRPSLPKEVKEYNAYEAQRLFITPGLTCIWQTSAHRDSISFDEWVDMDIKYIRERSWLGDLKLIFKTVAVVFKCDGE